MVVIVKKVLVFNIEINDVIGVSWLVFMIEYLIVCRKG